MVRWPWFGRTWSWAKLLTRYRSGGASMSFLEDISEPETGEREPPQTRPAAIVWEMLSSTGDQAVACLGFAAGIGIDLLSHGTTVVGLGSAATLGATAALGLKKAIETTAKRRWLSQSDQISSVSAARALRDEYSRALNQAQLSESTLVGLRSSFDSLEYYLRLRESGVLPEKQFQPKYESLLKEFIRLTAPSRRIMVEQLEGVRSSVTQEP